MTRPKWRESRPRWHERGSVHEHGSRHERGSVHEHGSQHERGSVHEPASGVGTTLVELPACSRAVVVGLPYARGLAKRLIALGLAPGTEVRVLQNWGHCPLIIEAHGARLALGRGQAARVTVEPLPGVDEEATHSGDEFCPGDV